MKTETREINGKEYSVLVAGNGKALQRVHDGSYMGREVVLGMDYSIKPPREDKAEYYMEVESEEEEAAVLPYDPKLEQELQEKDEALTILGIEL